MNNWLKIGLPIILAVLLVVTAVSLTLAITNGANGGRSLAYQNGNTTGVQYANGPYCYGWRSAGDNQNQNGPAVGYGPGRCAAWRWN
ncbi:MAG: hypothetical protein A2Z02_01885 [Chloroflexi bacterium RBG_16_48_7]|nr:MAG: hypothetical protein A2Z02_01885 [Chloroflexi bacterium RBG_16_48_7]